MLEEPIIAILKNHITAIKNKQHPYLKNIYIGFSGGADSTALVHTTFFLYKKGILPSPPILLHANHGILNCADTMAKHCQTEAERYGLKMIEKKLYLGKETSENKARTARWAFFTEHIENDDILLLGHHFNDQIETVWMRFLRGSGIEGLEGIKEKRKHQHFYVYRPFLNIEKKDLIEHLNAHKVTWFEDPSNTKPHTSRNIIRNEIMTTIKTNGLFDKKKISHTLNQIQNNNKTMVLLLTSIFKKQQMNHFGIVCLDQKKFLAESKHIQYQLLRQWYINNGFNPASHEQLKTFCLQLQQNINGGKPKISTKECSLLADRNKLFLLPNKWLIRLKKDCQSMIHEKQQSTAIIEQNLILYQHGNHKAEVVFIENDNRLKRSVDNKKLKKIWQEENIAAWLRAYFPCYLISNTENNKTMGLMINNRWLQADTETKSANDHPIHPPIKTTLQYRCPTILWQEKDKS